MKGLAGSRGAWPVRRVRRPKAARRCQLGWRAAEPVEDADLASRLSRGYQNAACGRDDALGAPITLVCQHVLGLLCQHGRGGETSAENQIPRSAEYRNL